MSPRSPSASRAREQTGTVPIRLTIGTERENLVDARLFGQFLERASFGEPGPEGALDPAIGATPAIRFRATAV